MYCKHCGKVITDDSIFCNYCGENQVKEKRTYYPVTYFDNGTRYEFRSFDVEIIDRLYQEAISKFPSMKRQLRRYEDGNNYSLFAIESIFYMGECRICFQFLLKRMLDFGYTEEIVFSQVGTMHVFKK